MWKPYQLHSQDYELLMRPTGTSANEALDLIGKLKPTFREYLQMNLHEGKRFDDFLRKVKELHGVKPARFLEIANEHEWTQERGLTLHAVFDQAVQEVYQKDNPPISPRFRINLVQSI